MKQMTDYSTGTVASNPLGVGLLAALAAIVIGSVLAFAGPLAAIALMLAGVAVALVLKNIEIGFWGVITVICILPFATIPIDIGLTPTFLDLSLGAVVSIWVLGLVTGRKRSIVVSPITLPLIVFVVVAIFAFIFGLSNGPLTSNLLRRFAELLLSMGFALVVVDYCHTWNRLARLVRVLIWAGAAAGALGIGLWLLPDGSANDALNTLQRLGYPGGWVIRYIEENPELPERAIGTSVDPNALGGLLLMVGALIAPQIVSKRPMLSRWQSVTFFGLVFVGLTVTFSRSAMLGLTAGLGYIALLRYRRLVPYMIVGALLFLLLPVTQSYVGRALEGLQGQDLATQMRFGEYRDALRLIGRYPLFGVGFAGSPDIDLYLGVASMYLTIGQQMGLLGLVSFFTLTATVFGYAVTYRGFFRSREWHDAIWLGLHAALVGGLVSGTLDHYLFNIDFHHAVTVFWLLIGLATASTRLGHLQQE